MGFPALEENEEAEVGWDGDALGGWRTNTELVFLGAGRFRDSCFIPSSPSVSAGLCPLWEEGSPRGGLGLGVPVPPMSHFSANVRGCLGLSPAWAVKEERLLLGDMPPHW